LAQTDDVVRGAIAFHPVEVTYQIRDRPR